nr:MAG TPA_asm: hypothetical protein [Caudoviricetes sp.]DAV04281.1 MAG TPA: hypothetical protein [Caudoviricetes sp.]
MPYKFHLLILRLFILSFSKFPWSVGLYHHPLQDAQHSCQYYILCVV